VGAGHGTEESVRPDAKTDFSLMKNSRFFEWEMEVLKEEGCQRSS